MDAERLSAVLGSVAVHLVLVGILAFTLWERPQPPETAVNKPIIQARAVDEATALEPIRRREAEERRKKAEAERKRQEAEAEKKRRVEEQRKKAEAEKQRQAEIKRKKAEAEKKRLAEEQRKAEEKRRTEAARKAEEERKLKEDIERRQQEMLQRMEAEAKQLEEEARQQRQQRLSRQQSQYVAAIQNKVARNWLRPPGSTGTLCTVVINQIPGGEITGVVVAGCDGDIAFQRSVEAAVRKASPLPMPADPELFTREIEFVFKP